MKAVFISSFTLLLCFSSYAQNKKQFDGSQAEQDSLKNTSIAIRKAFSRGDVNGILLFHHPDVEKALDYHGALKGIEALRVNLKGTLDYFHLEFIENQTESLFINGETAVEQALFVIKDTPKTKGEPFIFKGRAMITYVRYEGSPTGWATIREIVQPSTDN